MANVFVAFAQDDDEITSELFDKLREVGHNIIFDYTIFGEPLGSWRERLGPALREADVFIPVFSKHSESSSIFQTEVQVAQAFAESSGRMSILPVIIDDVPLPGTLVGVRHIDAKDRDFNRTTQELDRAIARFMGRLAAVEQQVAETAERVEQNIATYLDEAVTSQKKAEKSNWIFGTIWYAVGFLSLLVGVVSALWALKTTSYSAEIGIVINSVAKSVILVGFLGASARYCFVLGKSYVNESLKNSDRLHAMQFGRFYLRVFGNKTNWQELKEVFANWNISNNSSFHDLKTSDVDPKIIEAAIEFAKTFSSDRKSST